ncbi:MAG: GTP cyclohydrolase I FolE [Parvicellaceae bacterium]
MNFKKEKVISLSLDKVNNKLSNSKKTALIAEHFKSIMELLELDMTDNSLKDTPMRVAKMYVEELFEGLNPANKPVITNFENSFNYKGMILEKNINLYSICEHHFVPIIGKVHIAYFAKDKVIGLSKLNRIVHYLSKRPQVQEKLTVQIIDYLKKELETDDVACVVEAKHLCVSMRGIKDVLSLTTTAEYSGKFLENNIKQEMLQLIGANNE